MSFPDQSCPGVVISSSGGIIKIALTGVLVTFANLALNIYLEADYMKHVFTFLIYYLSSLAYFLMKTSKNSPIYLKMNFFLLCFQCHISFLCVIELICLQITRLKWSITKNKTDAGSLVYSISELIHRLTNINIDRFVYLYIEWQIDR